MAWIAVDCNIHTNPKLFDLAKELNLDPDATVGKLARLWTWAMQAENRTGELGNIPSDEIAAIMRWKKSADSLVNALVTCGFLDRDDGGISIHDWATLNGKFISKKLYDRERKS